MKDYNPTGYRPLSEALDLVSRRLSELSSTSGAEPLEQAIIWLRNVLAEEYVSAIAIAENGQWYKVGGALWRSQDAEGVFETDLLPAGNLRQTFQRRHVGTLHCRVHVHEGELTLTLRNHSTSKKIGRPRGAGSYAKQDEVLIEEMHQLMTSENPLSRKAVAEQVAPKAVGGGTEESKARRLMKGYTEKYR